MSDYVYDKSADKQDAVYYNKMQQTIIPPITHLKFAASAANPGGPRTLWLNRANGHYYGGADDLHLGAVPPPPPIPYETLDLSGVQWVDDVGANPISLDFRLVKVTGVPVIHCFIGASLGIKVDTQYYRTPTGAIPLAWRAASQVPESNLTFSPVSNVAAWDSDIMGLVRVSHTTGTIFIHRESPHTGTPNSWLGAFTGWHSMAMEWHQLTD